jgi:hypothetical protein
LRSDRTTEILDGLCHAPMISGSDGRSKAVHAVVVIAIDL